MFFYSVAKLIKQQRKKIYKKMTAEQKYLKRRGKKGGKDIVNFIYDKISIPQKKGRRKVKKKMKEKPQMVASFKFVCHFFFFCF